MPDVLSKTTEAVASYRLLLTRFDGEKQVAIYTDYETAFADFAQLRLEALHLGSRAYKHVAIEECVSCAVDEWEVTPPAP